jgi:hypothetical protein
MEKKGNIVGKQGHWTEAQIKAAIDKVQSKISIRRASEACSVPKSSLHDRLNKLNKAKNEILAPDMCTFRMAFPDEQEDLVAYVKDLDSTLMFVQVFGC